MSSKAYQEASKKLNNKCRDAIHNLYMAGTNHNGHSWNAFGDVENCLAVIIDEMYAEGAKEFAEWLDDNSYDYIDSFWQGHSIAEALADYEKEQKNEQ